MFNKVFNKAFEKLYKKAYPERKFSIESIGGRRFFVPHDIIECDTYVLDGTYSYEDVAKLIEEINIPDYTASFGFCAELGPIAFIGIPNTVNAKCSGYFKPDICAYGDVFECNPKLLYFNAYTDEEAKEIGNYTVYGQVGYSEVSRIAKIKKINGTYDSRYKEKRGTKINGPRVYDMACKVKGNFNFYDARLLATGTELDKEWFNGGDEPIMFATLDNGKHVGIINIWPSEIDKVLGFRDVWEYGKERPNVQELTFLSKDEASKIKDFELYLYTYRFSGVDKKKYDLEKVDRTLDERFDFILPDGTDYRLVSHDELVEEE